MNFKKNISKIIFVISAVLFMLAVVIFFFTYSEIQKNSEKLNAYNTEWNTMAGQKSGVYSLSHLLDDISKEKEEIDGRFASESDVVVFLDTLELLAPKTGVKMEVGSVSSKGENTRLQIGLKAMGSFSSVYKFLTLLENSPYELDFLSVDIHKTQISSSGDKKTKEPTWEGIFKIQLLSYIP